MLEFLKYSREVFGLNAPWFSWIAALGLLLWPAYEVIRLFIIYRKQSKNLEFAVNQLNIIKKERPIRFGEGFHLAAIEKIRDQFQKIPTLILPWNLFEKHLIFRKNKGGEEDLVWATESAEATFHEDAVIGTNFNRRFFLAIPGIVTGTGLLFTFLAILVALLDVRFNELNKQVEGLELLIGGLSGKFVSSVAALFSATLFLVTEKTIFHRLNIKRKQVVTAIDNLIPHVSQVQVLLEIQRDTSGQSDAFRMFSADLATKLKNSLDQSMGPIMERMVNAIDELNQFTRSAKDEMVSLLNQMNDLLREAERGKHETIAGQLEVLLKNIESSISVTLSTMGQSFKESLTGSTREEFSKVADTLGGTAVLLEKMNNQFEQSQLELKTLINLAKENYERQISTGQSQIENLAAVLNKLSEDMKKTIEDTSLKSSEFATGIISEVSNLSSENAEQLRILLEKHGSELSRVEELDKTLRDTLSNFNNSIKSYGQVTNDLKQVSTEVKTTVAMMSQVSKTMSEGQDSIKQVAVLAQTQIKTLAETNEKQREVWQRIYKTMEDYEQIFKRVENNSKALTNEIARCLEAYNAATHSGFEKILGTANETLGNAVGKLTGSINMLQELLDDLGEEISKFNNSRTQR